MEEFFSFCGVAIVALWLGNEVHHLGYGWVLPWAVGIAVFVLSMMMVFRRVHQLSPVLQGLFFAALAGVGFYRLIALNFTGDADQLGGFLCGLMWFFVIWAQMAKMKKAMR